MIWRRRLALVGAIVIAAILAFPLRGLVNDLILLPLAYILWLLRLLYLSLGQGIWWAVSIAVAIFILAQSLTLELEPARREEGYVREARGGVAALASMLRKSERSIYFKWLIANRLGKLTHHMLQQREQGQPRPVFAPLTVKGWEPPLEIRHYLEKGLQGSFAEFPTRRWFNKPKKTPLDHPVEEVVQFLESEQIDTR